MTVCLKYCKITVDLRKKNRDITVEDTPNDDNYRFNNCSGTVNANRERSLTYSPSIAAGYTYTITSSIDKDIITLTNSPDLKVQNFSKKFLNK